MKLKIVFALVAVIEFAALTVYAGSSWDGTAEVRYVTKSVFRGDKKANQSIRVSADVNPVTGEDGFFAGGWFNQPLSSKRDNEIDLFGGYRYHWENFVFDGGIIGYFYPESGHHETGYSYELYLSVQREILKNLSVMGTVYYDVRLEALTVEGATAYTIPYELGRLPASLDFSLFAGCSHIDDVFPDAHSSTSDGYSYYGATVSTAVWFNKRLNSSVGLHYGDTVNKAARTSPFSDKGDNNLYGYVAMGLKW